MPGVPKRVSLRGLMRPPPEAGGCEACPAGDADDAEDAEGLDGDGSWDGIGAEPAPRSWMGEAVVVDERRADVERRRLRAVEGSERTRGRGAKEKVDMTCVSVEPRVCVRLKSVWRVARWRCINERKAEGAWGAEAKRGERKRRKTLRRTKLVDVVGERERGCRFVEGKTSWATWEARGFGLVQTY
jgi:hypothetical protein